MIITLSPRARRGARWLLRISVPLLLVASLASPAAGQIFKCTAGSGQVTYQNEPCPKNFKADRVDIFDNSWTADRAEKDAQWQRQAAQHHVVAGMPLHWVREALGEPAEIRETATAGAKEVWLYNFPERSVQVGILADQVLWARETPVIAPQTRAAPEPDRAAAGASLAVPAEAPRAVTDAPPAPNPSRTLVGAAGTAPDASRPTLDPSHGVVSATSAAPDAPLSLSEVTRSGQPSPRVSETTHGVARGQDCKQALAALGKPDRQRDVPAVDSSSDPVSEYFYEPNGSNNPTRIRIVCANGKVEGVDRSIVR